MGAGKKIKIFVGILGVVLLAFLCLSGPVEEGDDSVRPLFGTVKVQLSSGRYNVDSKVLTAVLESGETEYLHLFHNLEAADFSGSSCYEEIAAWAKENPQVSVKYTVTLPDGSEYDNNTGAVYIDGKTWTARSADGDVIPAGAQAEILRMEGVKLFVRIHPKTCVEHEEAE